MHYFGKRKRKPIREYSSAAADSWTKKGKSGGHAEDAVHVGVELAGALDQGPQLEVGAGADVLEDFRLGVAQVRAALALQSFHQATGLAHGNQRVAHVVHDKEAVLIVVDVVAGGNAVQLFQEIGGHPVQQALGFRRVSAVQQAAGQVGGPGQPVQFRLGNFCVVQEAAGQDTSLRFGGGHFDQAR